MIARKTTTPHFRIVVDTSFLMMDNAQLCLQTELAHLILASGKQLAVPKQVVYELEHLQSCADPQKVARSQKALRLLQDKQTEWFQFFGEDDDVGYADHLFNTVFIKHAEKIPLVLLTQDRDLAHDISLLRDLRSFQIRPLIAIRVSPESGLIEVWDPLPNGKMQTLKQRKSVHCRDCCSKQTYNSAFLQYLQNCRVPLCPCYKETTQNKKPNQMR